MKTFYTILAALIFSVSGYAQQATVTATIAAYAGGSVVANFQRQGGGAPSSLMTSGTLNGSGVFTLNGAWNNAYSGYAPSVTSFTICATNTPATCYSANVQITSASQDISSAFTGAPNPGGGGGGAVSSVFGRSGVVVAVANDYTADQIGSGTVTGHGWVCGAGCVWTALNGGFNNANEINGATLPISAAALGTNSSGQPVAATITPASIGAAVATKPAYTFWAFGDSYMIGVGVPTPSVQSGFNLLAASTAAPSNQSGAASGLVSPSVTNATFQIFAPSPIAPSVTFMDGGANDGTNNTCGAGLTTGCAYNYLYNINAAIAFTSIPYNYRMFASNAAQTGSWATSGYPLAVYADPTLASQGTPTTTTTSGSTLTFSVPSSASAKLGITYQVTNSNTGTFTVSIDGTAQTNGCSSNTTFSGGPCSAVAIVQTSSTFFRQEFSVTPNTSHTVVITTGNTQQINIVSVDWLPPASTANVSGVFYMGPNAFFALASTYDTLAANTASQFVADGLPVFYVSQINGTPGVNATTDVSTSATTTCTASTTAGHPNSCGYVHMAQTVQNVATAVGYVFSSYNVNTNSTAGIFTGALSVASGISVNLPNTIPTTTTNFSNFNKSNIVPTASFPGIGIDWYRNSQRVGIGWGWDTSTGLPYSSTFSNRDYGDIGWYCHAQLNGGDVTISETAYTAKWCMEYASGNTVQVGAPGYVIGAPIASATTIAPLSGLTHITGTAAIATITPPTNFTATSGGCITLWPDAAFQWTNAGNIVTAAATSIVNHPLRACWGGTSWALN